MMIISLLKVSNTVIIIFIRIVDIYKYRGIIILEVNMDILV
jgi:hypothetical protein